MEAQCLRDMASSQKKMIGLWYTVDTKNRSEMRLRDYGYQTKKNDVLRERALTSAFREKGANWVNTQLKNMLRVAKESESRVIFLDMCNFIGSSTDGEIRKTMKVYEEVLEDIPDHTAFLDSAVFKIGWRNVYAWLDGYFCNQNDEKIKKDMDYVIEVHSHRKRVMEQMAREKELKEQSDKSDEDEDEDEEDEEESDEYKDLGDEESISLRDYGYSVHKTQRGRIGALKRAVAEEGIDLVCERLEKLGKYHPVMLEDLKSLKPSDVVESCCECVSAEEIRTIVREELSKVFGDIKKMNEDMQEMYLEMIA